MSWKKVLQTGDLSAVDETSDSESIQEDCAATSDELGMEVPESEIKD